VLELDKEWMEKKRERQTAVGREEKKDRQWK
jgi:hypothetical protein